MINSTKYCYKCKDIHSNIDRYIMDIHKYVYNEENSFLHILYTFQPHKCKIVIYIFVLITTVYQKFKWPHAV